jgi:RNA polymerase sigma-70 factor (ECF subfamily)
MDDRSLVHAICNGDQTAARRLIDRYQDVVFGLCYRMLSHRQDAEDIAQETFLRAFRALARFDPDRPLRPWLLGIAANRCRTALANRSRLPRLADSIAEPVDWRPGIGDPDDLSGELNRAIDRLRPDYRLVFSLFHEQGVSYEEISQAIDRPIGTVKVWIHRARHELAAHLARRGVHC